MNLFGNSRIALNHMVKKPLRTFLVLQGMIWAVAVAIFPHSLQEGSLSRSKQNPGEFGLDTITLHAEGHVNKQFFLRDINRLRRKYPKEKIADLTPVKVVNGQFRTGDAAITVQFIGTDENMPNVRTFHVDAGKYLTRQDVEHKREVCVLESGIAEKLFGKEDPLGKKLPTRIGGREIQLEVVGVMEKRSEDRLNTNELGFRYRSKKKMVAKMMYVLGLKAYVTEWKRTETGVHLPISLLTDDRFNWFIVKTDVAKAFDLAEDIQAFFLKEGREIKVYSNLFLPIMLENRVKIKSKLTLAVFIICLILGGVMIMNVMLLSVIERYREIAIRRVEGACRRDIVFQFLTEGIVLCLVATVLGIPLGLLMGMVVARAEPWAIASVGIPYSKLPFCIIWAVAIGTFSAILPARKAATLDPAEILRQK